MGPSPMPKNGILPLWDPYHYQLLVQKAGQWALCELALDFLNLLAKSAS